MKTQRGFATILAIVVGLLIIGGGAYLYTSSGDNEMEDNESSSRWEIDENDTGDDTQYTRRESEEGVIDNGNENEANHTNISNKVEVGVLDVDYITNNWFKINNDILSVTENIGSPISKIQIISSDHVIVWYSGHYNALAAVLSLSSNGGLALVPGFPKIADEYDGDFNNALHEKVVEDYGEDNFEIKTYEVSNYDEELINDFSSYEPHRGEVQLPVFVEIEDESFLPVDNWIFFRVKDSKIPVNVWVFPMDVEGTFTRDQFDLITFKADSDERIRFNISYSEDKKIDELVEETRELFTDLRESAVNGQTTFRLRKGENDYDSDVVWYFMDVGLILGDIDDYSIGDKVLQISISGHKEWVFDDDSSNMSTVDRILSSFRFN